MTVCWRRCASSLLALSAAALLLVGCGASSTRTPAEVRQAFARYGIDLVPVDARRARGFDVLGRSTPEPARPGVRLDAIGARWAYALETLAARHAGNTPLLAPANGVAVEVYDTPQALPPRRLLAFLHAHVAVAGNVLVVWSGPGLLVRPALLELRR